MTVVLKQFSCTRKMTTLHCIYSTYLTNCIICNVDMFYLIFNILTSHWPRSVCGPVLAVLTRCWLQEVFWSAAAAGPGEASIWQDRKKFGKHRIPHSDADGLYSEYNQWILLISTHAGFGVVIVNGSHDKRHFSLKPDTLKLWNVKVCDEVHYIYLYIL